MINYDLIFDNGDFLELRDQTCFTGIPYLKTGRSPVIMKALEEVKKKIIILQKINSNGFRLKQANKMQNDVLREKGYTINKILFHVSFVRNDKVDRYLSFLFKAFPYLQCIDNKGTGHETFIVNAHNKSASVMQLLVGIRYLIEKMGIIEKWFDIVEKYDINEYLAYILAHYNNFNVNSSNVLTLYQKQPSGHHSFTYLEGRSVSCEVLKLWSLGKWDGIEGQEELSSSYKIAITEYWGDTGEETNQIRNKVLEFVNVNNHMDAYKIIKENESAIMGIKV